MKYLIVVLMLFLINCSSHTAIICCTTNVDTCIKQQLGENVKVTKKMKVDAGVYIVDYK